ncbi:hypothetical protein ACIBKX_16050 [Streptomyces sp. NPDC050658]|uniref:hypothetical protein n=1 Tax=unclassified Streptomyces TaxID=2593676 RepID=UPI00343072DD
MANTFGRGPHSLDLANSGTAVFIDALTLAVSDLADEEWDFRFAALLTLQNQEVMGRGAVGFDLEDIEWGGTPQERSRARDFVLRATELAMSGHRWSELDYESPTVHGYLRQFRAMVEEFTPAERTDSVGVFPRPAERAVASCARHRILTALPYWDGCFLCTRLPSEQG